jgi:hypothetical protein
MTHRLQNLLRLIVPAPDGDGHVHFHTGPQGRPAACHDARCASPRLTV